MPKEASPASLDASRICHRSGSAPLRWKRAFPAACRQSSRSLSGPEFSSRELRLAYHVFQRAGLLRQQLLESSRPGARRCCEVGNL